MYLDHSRLVSPELSRFKDSQTHKPWMGANMHAACMPRSGNNNNNSNNRPFPAHLSLPCVVRILSTYSEPEVAWPAMRNPEAREGWMQPLQWVWWLRSTTCCSFKSRSDSSPHHPILPTSFHSNKTNRSLSSQ